jgi:hypothetical protein
METGVKSTADFDSGRALDDPPAAPSGEEVIEALQRMVASPDFPASERNARFLQRVVMNSLKGEKTSASEVATQVFGRMAPFDATADPIVRIEASKLRRDLETYYLKSGRHDRVRISMPKGRYLARFSYDGAATAGMPSAGHLLILRAALLGWRGEVREARAAWSALRQEYPDFHFNPRMHTALDAISGQDNRIRELLLEGLQHAAEGGRGADAQVA